MWRRSGSSRVLLSGSSGRDALDRSPQENIMSEFITSLVISGSIFAVVMLSQFGRREYTWRKVLIPLAFLGYFGYTYLHDLPTAGNAAWLYLTGVLIGLLFGTWASATTGVEKDAQSGKLYTRTGGGFVVAWLVAMGLRVAFVYAVENVSSFRDQVGTFMLSHQLVEGSIAPFFVLMALTTVVSRIAVIRLRTSLLNRTVRPMSPLQSTDA
jgi:nitrate reductase gamma subunit